MTTGMDEEDDDDTVEGADETTDTLEELRAAPVEDSDESELIAEPVAVDEVELVTCACQ